MLVDDWLRSVQRAAGWLSHGHLTDAEVADRICAEAEHPFLVFTAAKLLNQYARPGWRETASRVMEKHHTAFSNMDDV